MEKKYLPLLKEFKSEKMNKINLFQTANFFTDIYCFEPGQTQKLHTHSDAEKIYYVLEGEGQFQIGEDQATLGAGNIIFAPANVAHGVINNSANRLVLLVFMAPNPHFGA